MSRLYCQEKSGMLQFMELQRVGHILVTENKNNKNNWRTVDLQCYVSFKCTQHSE